MARAERPRAVLFGCAGPSLSAEERAFFAAANPLGFILFARNCQTPEQVRALVAALRDSVGRADTPVLIDQEGGRVARLGPPHWRKAPPAARFGALAAVSLERARRAVWLNARLIAAELAALGITVDCAPVLDLALPETHRVIGDRAYGAEPALVAELGRACCDGLLAGGVLPVLKHMPGHGRARVDSHLELPEVGASRALLAAIDLAPFKALADQPWAMTAHVRYRALDPASPATLSRTVVQDVIRGELGFDGVLVSDDLGMKALAGGLDALAAGVLAAGCDLGLHCSGVPAEMAAVIAGTAPLSEAAARRIARGDALISSSHRRAATAPFDAAAALAELDALLVAS